MKLSLLFLAALVCVACNDKGKSDAPPAEQPAAPAATQETARVDDSPAEQPAAPATKAAAGSFTGSYESKPGSLYVPDHEDYKSVKWRGEESQEGLGKGTFTLEIDADGSLHGEGEGPLGAFLIIGRLEGERLGGTITRKNPADYGFTGMLSGTRKDGGFSGTFNVARGDASVLRTGSFTLTAK